MLLYVKKYLWLIIGSILTVSLIGEIFFIINKENDTNNAKSDVVIKEPKESFTEEYIWVEIKGAVNKPGVYEMPKVSIVNDVISVANGLKKDAYTDNINLSQKIGANMIINIYTQKEYQTNPQPKLYENCYVNSYDITKCLNEGYSIIITNSNVANDAKTNLININTADKNLLMSLNGIGEAKAEAIISYRESKGNFKNISELKNVKGIGEALFDQIKSYLTV